MSTENQRAESLSCSFSLTLRFQFLRDNCPPQYLDFNGIRLIACVKKLFRIFDYIVQTGDNASRSWKKVQIYRFIVTAD